MVNSPENSGSGRTRRAVLQGALATGMTAVLPTTAAAAESEPLGTFEEGLDGWKTNGSNILVRVSNEEFSGVVTGSHGLGVRTEGDSYPMIENTTRLDEVDLVNAPYLSVDVLPIIFNTDSDIVFQFVLHSTPSGQGEGGKKGGKSGKNKSGRGEKKKGGKGGKENGQNPNQGITGRPRAVASDEIRVSEQSATTLMWDLSTYSSTVRQNAKRLEIRWHPADRDPRGNARGNGPSKSEYRGFTIFDSIQVSDSPAEIEETQLVDDLTNLRVERGFLTSVETTERSDGYEAGQFMFSDGTAVEYVFERIDRDQYRYTVDGTVYRLGGGWA